MDNLKCDFLSDISEFWFFDEEFRDAVNDEKNVTAVDTRIRIQELLLGIVQAFDIKYPKQIFNKQKGEITVLPKSPVRKQALNFLDSLLEKDEYSAVFANQAPHRNYRADYSLTEFERDKKREAKETYKEGRFQEALEIVLGLLRQNPKLQYNPGIIGFIANCYNKLGDSKNALHYAEQSLKLDEENITALGIAALAAQRLELWDKALSYAERCLKLGEENITALGIAALAAQKLELWDEALGYAGQCLELGENVTALNIATHVAHKTKNFELAIKYGELLLGIYPDNGLIQTIVSNARERLSV